MSRVAWWLHDNIDHLDYSIISYNEFFYEHYTIPVTGVCPVDFVRGTHRMCISPRGFLLLLWWKESNCYGLRAFISIIINCNESIFHEFLSTNKNENKWLRYIFFNYQVACIFNENRKESRNFVTDIRPGSKRRLCRIALKFSWPIARWKKCWNADCHLLGRETSKI